jgi:hypothetical protein
MENKSKKRIRDVLSWVHLAGYGIHEINVIIDEVVKLITTF